MLFWWKGYIQEWKASLFLVLQMVIVLFWVNAQVSALVEEYDGLTVVKQTDNNMYFYQNAIGVLRDDWGFEGFQHAEEKLRQMEGLEDIAYDAWVPCEVDGYRAGGGDLSGEVIHRNLSPQMWKGLQYRLEEGRWFTEQDAGDDTLQIIIGGGLAGQYKAGDTLTLQYNEGQVMKEALVIGSLGTECSLLDESFDTNGNSLDKYLYSYGEESAVILSNDTKWPEEFRGMAEFPYLSVMVKIREGTDLSAYEKYGVLSSFDEVMENTRKKCRQYIGDAISENGIWILVILFGVTGVSYITAGKRRYAWGIYSLLGMTGNELLRNLMLQNALTYLLGGLAASIAHPYLARLLNYEYRGFGMENVIATGVLIAVMFAAGCLCNRYIRKISPKEVLNLVKE